jgi:Flp pilus assembly protein TadD
VWSNWNALGSIQLQAGKLERARHSFARAAALAPPDTPWPQANLGVAALYEGDFESAVAVFSAIPPAAADAELASNMGTAYFYVGELDRAEALYRQAVELRPNDPALHRNLADLYARQGRPEQAREEYAQALTLVERALAATPEHPRLRLARAQYAAKAGECEVALEQAAALRLSLPATAENAHRLAQTFAVCGDRSAALTALAEAIALGRRRDLLAEEDEFRSLREDPEFRNLMAGEGPPENLP